MFDIFKIPRPVIEKMEELDTLIDQYPIRLPLPEVARFLGTESESLRAAIDGGGFSPGYSWKKVGMKNKGYSILTTSFYFWYTQHAGIWAEMIRREAETRS